MSRFSIRFQPGFYIILAVSVLYIPIQWVLAWTAAAAVHEIFHMISLKLCGYNILSMRVGAGGAQLETDGGNDKRMILCAMAGPVGGLLPVLLLRQCPRLALCALFQTAYNLLPIYPLDGGRVLGILISLFLPPKFGNILSYIIENAVLVVLLAFAVYASIHFHVGILPVVLASGLIAKKYLANKGLWRYNSVICREQEVMK